MASCLGIYVQNNLIKYAKVSKERNNIKIEAYGIKFFEDEIEKVIEQIVKETFSYKIPISVNIDKENYTYSNVFNLLKPQDQEKAINTEFDFFCNNNNKNRNAIEFRRMKAPNTEDKDKTRVIYAYTDKSNLAGKIQLVEKYGMHELYPVATIIPNINKSQTQENCAIVNIEQKTEITTIVNGNVYKIDKIEDGMNKIISFIAEKENSVKRAYEICKNTTVYTKTGQNLKIDGNEYLDDIITILLDIIEKVKEIIINNGIQIDSIYITGIGLIINNIDLLFQENFLDKKCEILVPGFIEKTNVKINIKDYIEVNSAISLALQGLEDIKNKETNFVETNGLQEKLRNFWSLLSSDVGKGNKTKQNKVKYSFKQVMNSELDLTDKLLLRFTTAIILTIIMYIIAAEVLTSQIYDKTEEVKKIIAKDNEQIQQIDNYETLIKTRTSEYQNIVDRINQMNSQITSNYSSKNAIPNLLNKIMYNIPKGVQLLSISNDAGKMITITAQAELYDQLGYFKAVLEEEGILYNVTTTKGSKQENKISVTITGELPY